LSIQFHHHFRQVKSENTILYIVLVLLLDDRYCTNREGFVAEVLTKGNVGSLRELPNTRGVGLSRLQSALSESLLLWVTAKSKTLHKSSTSLFGMVLFLSFLIGKLVCFVKISKKDPVLAKRPLAYISNHDDLTFAVSSNSPNLFYTFLRRSVSVVGHFDLNRLRDLVRVFFCFCKN
jgi:hypothetical protein